MYLKRTGFTIVELLIVIVVIGILAAITVVAYNGIQQRARVATSLSDLKHINTAIQMYHADHGSYPTTSGAWRGLQRDANYIPELVPKYMSALPQSSAPTPPPGTPGTVPNSTGYPAAYGYRSDGTDYKLMAHGDGLCPDVKKQQPALVSPFRDCWAYGYWSPGGAAF